MKLGQQNRNASPVHGHAHRLGIRTGVGDDWFRLGGVKVWADGSIPGGTAAFSEPYHDPPRLGHLNHTLEELTADPRVRQLIQTEVDACNKELARFESVVRFELLVETPSVRAIAAMEYVAW